MAGTFLNHPARKTPWLLLAAAQASFAAGQLSFLIAARLGIVLPFPSFADVLYLSTLSALCRRAADLHLLPVSGQGPAQPDRRADAHGRSRTALLDVPDPALRAQRRSCPSCRRSWRSPTRSATCSSLALLARLLAPGRDGPGASSSSPSAPSGAWRPTWPSAWSSSTATFHNGTIIDLGWAVFYTAWGASALHPTMARLTEPVPRQQEEVSPGRLALLMLASLIAPVVLLTTRARRPDLGRQRDRGVLRGPVPARADPAVGRGRRRTGARSTASACSARPACPW